MECIRKVLSSVSAIGFATTLAFGLAVGLAIDRPATAAEPPTELTWRQLVPQKAKPELRSFLAGRTPFRAKGPVDLNDFAPHPGDAPPPRSEDRWMSSPTVRRSSEPPAVVADLNGKRVKIGGYVVPLDFEATEIKEFLLVPFVGACIHVPPPPPNQIVYVKTDKGFRIKDLFDPVYVTGKMSTEIAFTGLAEAGYTIDAETVDAR